MDVYHRVLLKLFEDTGGNDSKAVDFADLVKKLGFHANYGNIFKELSVQGWIVETGKADWVKLTHWGIEEVNKSRKGESGDKQEITTEFKRLVSEARELVGLLETLTTEMTKENFSTVEKKLSQINARVNDLKTKI